MYDALDVANYVLGYYSFEKNINISNLKLQKLLYFLQANHLVMADYPLFVDEIEAWNFGPVIYNVYRKFMIYGGGSIPFRLIDKDKEYSLHIHKDDKEIISEVLEDLQAFSSTILLHFIHNQKPWKDSYYNPSNIKLIKRNNEWQQIRVIPNQLLYDYFK